MLSRKQIQAARMIAEGELLQQEIAQQLKITPQTLVNWKKNEEFMKNVGGIKKFSKKVFTFHDNVI